MNFYYAYPRCEIYQISNKENKSKSSILNMLSRNALRGGTKTFAAAKVQQKFDLCKSFAKKVALRMGYTRIEALLNRKGTIISGRGGAFVTWHKAADGRGEEWRGED